MNVNLRVQYRFLVIVESESLKQLPIVIVFVIIPLILASYFLLVLSAIDQPIVPNEIFSFLYISLNRWNNLINVYNRVKKKI